MCVTGKIRRGLVNHWTDSSVSASSCKFSRTDWTGGSSEVGGWKGNGWWSTNSMQCLSTFHSSIMWHCVVQAQIQIQAQMQMQIKHKSNYKRHGQPILCNGPHSIGGGGNHLALCANLSFLKQQVAQLTLTRPQFPLACPLCRPDIPAFQSVCNQALPFDCHTGMGNWPHRHGHGVILWMHSSSNQM